MAVCMCGECPDCQAQIEAYEAEVEISCPVCDGAHGAPCPLEVNHDYRFEVDEEERMWG